MLCIRNVSENYTFYIEPDTLSTFPFLGIIYLRLPSIIHLDDYVKACISICTYKYVAIFYDIKHSKTEFKYMCELVDGSHTTLYTIIPEHHHPCAIPMNNVLPVPYGKMNIKLYHNIFTVDNIYQLQKIKHSKESASKIIKKSKTPLTRQEIYHIKNHLSDKGHTLTKNYQTFFVSSEMFFLCEHSDFQMMIEYPSKIETGVIYA